MRRNQSLGDEVEKCGKFFTPFATCQRLFKFAQPCWCHLGFWIQSCLIWFECRFRHVHARRQLKARGE